VYSGRKLNKFRINMLPPFSEYNNKWRRERWLFYLIYALSHISFYTRSQNWGKRLTDSSCLSVCPMEQRGSHWKNFN
jgi:hypothetical protein